MTTIARTPARAGTKSTAGKQITKDAIIAGKLATVRSSVTKGTPAIAGMATTAGMQAKAVTQATDNSKHDSNSKTSVVES
jgi:hypothetical protein